MSRVRTISKWSPPLFGYQYLLTDNGNGGMDYNEDGIRIHTYQYHYMCTVIVQPSSIILFEAYDSTLEESFKTIEKDIIQTEKDLVKLKS